MTEHPVRGGKATAGRSPHLALVFGLAIAWTPVGCGPDDRPSRRQDRPGTDDQDADALPDTVTDPGDLPGDGTGSPPGNPGASSDGTGGANPTGIPPTGTPTGTGTGTGDTLPDPNAYDFPGTSWVPVSDVAPLGWSAEKLAAARRYADTLDTAAVVVVHRGHLIAQWGNVNTKYRLHSVRKSFMSGLYGIQVARGVIDPSATLATLGISDKGGLSATEQTAKVSDLLKARSCIYHGAAAETPSMQAARPARYSCSPGERWYYNNWDFNALGTIYRNKTGHDIFESLKELIADPIGMEHFATTDGSYQYESVSDHPAYHMKMSASDMARYGLLFLNWGRWRDTQIIPRQWVEESTRSWSDTTGGGGYGYMWWVSGRSGATRQPYHAAGVGGQKILVDPDRHLVVVHRVDTNVSGNDVSSSNFKELMSRIYAARVGGW